MGVNVIYKTKATATGGRDGAARSEDGSVDVKLVVPKEMGGPGGEGANPEKLFAAGYSACFLGAMKAVSGKEGVKVPQDATVTAEVGFGPREEGGYGITVDLLVNLPGVDRAEGEKLMHAAHEVCPYSNATRNNVDVGLTLA
ncbi:MULTISPECIES: organic hydroperoxide resistance protein [Sphingomonas]|jgi:osmotically inducible protein OsmC|uniref:Organic hydroperoxide resistance protein n=1 Tax=Sphingomonas parapaucimobilis NBRC 15100 TaxID=1219049 RepID=A0A0A1W5M9_9SPHN|nr:MULTISPECIES: organic hydroperoxide resistance protein [Sphingomonas]KQO51282.1 organic hydroperoxide resistance protein [Sphingomonas sp. Leaf257]OMJ30898.1 organic hydroperoxide resistance protein [Sphingomonas sp. Sph1(2015)]GAM00477.1 organic hydroperoxide resistance protein [Sphingomonas parapaucimobilis NBRC 15100]